MIARTLARSKPRPYVDPELQANKRVARGSPPAIRNAMKPSNKAPIAIPAIKIRSGAYPDFRVSAKIAPRVMNAPIAAPEICNQAVGASIRKTIAIIPIAAPALTPRLSGLAIGFAVMRCNMVPAIASMVPAAIAPRIRGPRHGQTVFSALPN